MKAFEKINGKYVVYVQLLDIKFIMESIRDVIPQFITDLGIGLSLSKRYILFTEEEAVKFFREADYIIDYRNYADLNLEELQKEENIIRARFHEKYDKYQDDARYPLREEIEKFNHRINAVVAMRQAKMFDILIESPIEISSAEGKTPKVKQ